MKLTFPRLGHSHIYGALLFKEIGIDIVIPPANSIEGLERGAAHSPEDICLPFKIILDNLLSAWEMGADTVIMPATMGPCRLGEYGELLRVTLGNMGCNYHFILLDSVSAIGIEELIRRLKSIIQDSKCSYKDILKALRKTYRLIKIMESLEGYVALKGAYEKKGNSSKVILRECRNALESTDGLDRAIEIVKGKKKELADVKVDRNRRPLKLLLTGDIFTQIDEFANHYIEDSLMEMKVAFEKNMSIGWWIRNTIINPFGGIMAEKSKNPYMPYRIGGYAKETVGQALKWRQRHYDGIIQLFPAGCMPEIVAKSVFEGLSQSEGIPILSVIYDEMNGDVGYLTRIEAFTDMLLRKRDS